MTSLYYHIRQVAARVAKLVLGCAFGTAILQEGEVFGSAMVTFERAMMVSYRLSSVRFGSQALPFPLCSISFLHILSQFTVISLFSFPFIINF